MRKKVKKRLIILGIVLVSIIAIFLIYSYATKQSFITGNGHTYIFADKINQDSTYINLTFSVRNEGGSGAIQVYAKDVRTNPDNTDTWILIQCADTFIYNEGVACENRGGGDAYYGVGNGGVGITNKILTQINGIPIHNFIDDSGMVIIKGEIGNAEGTYRVYDVKIEGSQTVEQTNNNQNNPPIENNSNQNNNQPECVQNIDCVSCVGALPLCQNNVCKCEYSNGTITENPKSSNINYLYFVIPISLLIIIFLIIGIIKRRKR